VTCRHQAGDPNCSSHPDYTRSAAYFDEQRASESLKADLVRRRREELEASTPDPDKYAIEDVTRVGHHLVLKVKYPSCTKCAFEGSKVMVFLNVSEMDALRWRRIDPHFRDPKTQPKPNEAPSPAARFPASKEGWADAVRYAESKAGEKKP
jgi:hypothetical protein